MQRRATVRSKPLGEVARKVQRRSSACQEMPVRQQAATVTKVYALVVPNSLVRVILSRLEVFAQERIDRSEPFRVHMCRLPSIVTSETVNGRCIWSLFVELPFGMTTK
jgi:hypothetical protein